MGNLTAVQANGRWQIQSQAAAPTIFFASTANLGATTNNRGAVLILSEPITLQACCRPGRPRSTA